MVFKMNQIYKEALRDARMVYRLVNLRMSFLSWMTNKDMKSAKAEKEKERILNEPDTGIRATIATVYNNEAERQFWWKTFFEEYNRLVSQEG